VDAEGLRGPDEGLSDHHGRRWRATGCAALTHGDCRPTGNAVVERVIRTLEEELLWLRDEEDAQEVARAVEACRRKDNEARPHSALGWKMPSAWRAANLPANDAVSAAA
jgi:putative transposase